VTTAETPVHAPGSNRRSLAASFYGAGIFVLVGFVLWIGQGVIVPFVISAFLSFLIVTLKRGIERVPGAKYLPETLLFVLAFATIMMVAFILASIIRNNIDEFIMASADYNARIIEIGQDLFARARDLPGIGADIEESLANVQSAIISRTDGLLGGIANVASGLAGNLITVVLYTAFMLAERGRFLKKAVKIAEPYGATDTVSHVIDDIGRLVREYISVKTLTSLMVAGISWVILTLLGIDFAGFRALLVFSLNFIPVIGSIIAVILPTFLALVQPGGGIGLFIATAILLTAAEQVVGSLIEPRMLGRSLNLSPLIILVSLATWGTLWGIAGAFLCVPMTVAIMIILAQFPQTLPVAILLSDNGEIGPLQKGERMG